MKAKKKIFLAGDHHLFHNKIIEFGRSQFASIEEHNEFIIERHNSVVGPDDVCKFFGDVCLSATDPEQYKILDRFNGTKHLIIGNHDTPARIREYHQYFTKIMAYDTAGQRDGRSAKIIMSHIPVHPSELESRFEKSIHAHLHDDIIKLPNGERDLRYFGVSMEQINYTPVLLDSVFPL